MNLQFVGFPQRSRVGREYSFPAQQHIGAQGPANDGKYLGNTGRSWVKRLSFQLNAYSRPNQEVQDFSLYGWKVVNIRRSVTATALFVANIRSLCFLPSYSIGP